MRNVTQSEGPVNHNQPLTHAAYRAHVSTAAFVSLSAARPLVQVRRRGVVLCGQVQRLGYGQDGAELLLVDTDIGGGWYVPQNVRLCSGDGRCVCEETRKGFCADKAAPAQDSSAAQAAGFSQAGVVAPPESLTGETGAASGGRWEAWAKSAVRRMHAAGVRAR